MDHATGTTGRIVSASISRRGFALGLALLAGSRLAPGAAAEKNTGKKPPSIRSRVKDQRDLCETMGGGKLTVSVRPGGTTTTCTGGAGDGRVCTNSSNNTRCFQARTTDGPLHDFEPDDPFAPIVPGEHHDFEPDAPAPVVLNGAGGGG